MYMFISFYMKTFEIKDLKRLNINLVIFGIEFEIV